MVQPVPSINHAGPNSPLTTNSELSAPGGPEDGGLFPQLPEPLRSHAQYIEAALSTYGGGPAGADVARAWGAITRELIAGAPKLYRFHFLTGRSEDGAGRDVAEAFRLLGYGGGAIRALDYYEEVRPALGNTEPGDDAKGGGAPDVSDEVPGMNQ